MPSLEFLGVGDATDFALGQTSVLYQGSCNLLIDCGPQIPAALTARYPSADVLDGIYITHVHADHCFGLAALLLWMRQAGRRRPLEILAEEQILAAVYRLVELGYPGAFVASKCFPILLTAIAPHVNCALGSATLTISRTVHNVPNFALRIDDAGTCVAVSGDGRPSGEAASFFTDLELLVHECATLGQKSVNHTHVAELVELVHRVQCKRLAVTHCAREQRAAIEASLRSQLGDVAIFPRPLERIYWVAE